MIQVAVVVVVYGLIAAASPLVFTTALVVVGSERPRVDGAAFLAGFEAGAVVAAILGLTVGDAVVERLDSHESVTATLALLLGVALLGAGLWERRTARPTAGTTPRRSPRLERLEQVGPATAMAVAALLGLGGPKRLALTFLAMGSVSGSAAGDLERVGLVVLYLVVGTVVVWAPVGMVLVAGSAATELLRRGESWLAANRSMVGVRLFLGLGAVLVVDGVLRLVA